MVVKIREDVAGDRESMPPDQQPQPAAHEYRSAKRLAEIPTELPTATPATPSAAFPVGRKVDDPVTNYLNDVFTVPANLAGLPGISVPAGLNQAGLPLGLQVLAKPFDEAAIYKVAKVIEDSAAISTMPQRMAGGL